MPARGRSIAAALIVITAAACSRDEQVTQTTLAPLVTNVTIPASTDLTTTTLAALPMWLGNPGRIYLQVMIPQGN